MWKVWIWCRVSWLSRKWPRVGHDAQPDHAFVVTERPLPGLGIGRVLFFEKLLQGEHGFGCPRLLLRVGAERDLRLQLLGFLAGIGKRDIPNGTDALVAGLATSVTVSQVPRGVGGIDGTDFRVQARRVCIAPLDALLLRRTIQFVIDELLG